MNFFIILEDVLYNTGVECAFIIGAMVAEAAQAYHQMGLLGP